MNLFEQKNNRLNEKDTTKKVLEKEIGNIKKNRDGNFYDFGSEIEAIDVSDKKMEKVARGYFLGTTAIGRRRDVRKILEERVVDKIGKKGKYLTDKLFELIEGVYITDSITPTKTGEKIRYYKTPPSLQAIIYALDRVLGKPKQMNVTASFSLSKLLIEDGTKRESGQDDNSEV